MELVIMMVVGIGLYFFSDQLLKRIEAARGKPFENKSVPFFLILVSSAIVVFYILDKVLNSGTSPVVG